MTWVISGKKLPSSNELSFDANHCGTVFFLKWLPEDPEWPHLSTLGNVGSPRSKCADPYKILRSYGDIVSSNLPTCLKSIPDMSFFPRWPPSSFYEGLIINFFFSIEVHDLKITKYI